MSHLPGTDSFMSIDTGVSSTLVEALYRISSLATQKRDPKKALKRILAEIKEFFGASSASIALINPDTRMLEIEVSSGLPEQSRTVQLRLGVGVTGWVALHGKPLLVGDVTEDPRYLPVREAVRCEMAVPMMEEENAVAGVINLDSETPDAWSYEDLQALRFLAAEATKALHRLWLDQQLRAKASQLQSLIRVSAELVAHREPEELLHRVTAEARLLMNARLSSLHLLTDDGEHLDLAGFSGDTPPLKHERLEVRESALGTAVRRLKQVEVNDLAKTEEHHFTELIPRLGLVSLLATPIVYEEKAIGVINIYTTRPHRFNNDEKALMITLARMSAVAVENARLYKRVFQTEETIRQNERLTTLGLLAAEIAHEIRNPLMVIKLLFEAMDLEFPEGDPRGQDHTIVAEKLDQLEKIVSRVLSFGKSQGGLHCRFDLRQVISDTLHLVRLKLEQCSVALHYQKPEEPIRIEGSKGQLQQALINLIFNSLQAMPDGGELTISIDPSTASADEPRVAVDIEDTGGGIPKAMREQIFESFLSGSNEGTGLGLAIAKRILVSHRGDIEVAETGPHGTRMRLWLPRCPAE